MKKGMTLIEVLVSSLILVISITAILMSLVVVKNMVRESVHKVNATEIINSHFEGIQRRKTDGDVDTFLSSHIVGGSVTFSPDTLSRILRINDNGELTWNYYLEFQVNDVSSSDVRQIFARVSWDNEYVSEDTEHSLYMAMFTNNTE